MNTHRPAEILLMDARVGVRAVVALNDEDAFVFELKHLCPSCRQPRVSRGAEAEKLVYVKMDEP